MRIQGEIFEKKFRTFVKHSQHVTLQCKPVKVCLPLQKAARRPRKKEIISRNFWDQRHVPYMKTFLERKALLTKFKYVDMRRARWNFLVIAFPCCYFFYESTFN